MRPRAFALCYNRRRRLYFPPRLSMADVTKILARVNAGDPGAADQLLPLVYDELRALAGFLFRGQRPNHTLQPTALVHEAYARMVKPAAQTDGSQDSAQWNSRAHFFAVAATAMRQVLANHARDHRREKRGGGWQRITLGEHITPMAERDLDLLALDEALESLAKVDARLAECVDLKFFCGFSFNEIAQLRDVSERTVQRDWDKARLLLNRFINDQEGQWQSQSA